VPPRLDLSQRQRIIHLEDPDIILLQMERHPLNRPRYYPSRTIVFDIDDADFLWPHARSSVIEACSGSRAVIAGSTWVAKWCRSYNADVEVIWTAGPALNKRFRRLHGERKNIIAWGHSRPQDYPDECEYIIQILERVAREVSVEFWLFGVSERRYFQPMIARLNACHVNVRQFAPMPYKLFTRKLCKAAVGIQVLSSDNDYSQGKSFGKILNYISAGVTVVASKAADHSKFFTSGVNGILADSLEEWSNAIVWLLRNPEKRRTMAELALQEFEKNLNIEVTAAKYDRVFRKIMNLARH
jgi:hypothetical protein